MSHTPLSKKKHAEILRRAGAGESLRQIARHTNLALNTVRKYLTQPIQEKPADNCQLPTSWAETYPPFLISGPQTILLLSDVHIPFHNVRALESAVEYGRKLNPTIVYLNGDALDFHQVSRYDHDGSKLTYQEEITAGVAFLRYLRSKFPKARLIFKEGNHEERLDKYILARAPALFGIENCTLAGLLQFSAIGVERIGEQRVTHCGKLRIIHGHEYGGGVNAPVSAARWLMLRARKHAICGHLHQTSEQIEQNMDGEQLATWSVGCLSGLHPRYRRLNTRWNHGFAVIRLAADGSFELDNKRIINGKTL
jgi:predicted phosphodiesterase